MRRVAVVTDSSATVPAELVQDLDVQVVPISLNIGGQSYRDGIDITSEQLYDWLRSSKRLPTTSAPCVGDFLRVYAKASQQASAIVSIHLSPDLSAIFQVATTASELLENIPIRVVNSRTAAMGQGFVVLEAARMAAAGAPLEAVVARAQELSSKVRLLATIDTLEYLQRGGRIGGAATLVGTVLQIKPVLHVTDGRVGVFARPRTKSKAVGVMLDQIAREAENRPVHVAVLHADVLEEAEALREKVRQRFDCIELFVTAFTPVMGAHTGPGVLGVAFYVE
jgi:DegV family protein with EDD domain